MKKNNQNSESINKEDKTGLNVEVGKIPNPIPNWMEPLFKTYTFCAVDINDGIIEGYPIDDDF